MKDVGIGPDGATERAQHSIKQDYDENDPESIRNELIRLDSEEVHVNEDTGTVMYPAGYSEYLKELQEKLLRLAPPPSSENNPDVPF
jgi:hypothetical protein